MARNWEHATTYGYRMGCRCAPCKQARSEDWQKYRHEYFETTVSAPQEKNLVEPAYYKRGEQPKFCTIIENGSSCPNKTTRRGWCHKHYMRWRMHGDPLYLVRPRLVTKRIKSAEHVGDNPAGRECTGCGEFKAWAFFDFRSKNSAKWARGRKHICFACDLDRQKEYDRKKLNQIPLEDVINFLGIEPPRMDISPDLEQVLREQYSDLKKGNFCPPEMFQAMSLDQEVASGLPFTEFMEFDDEPFSGQFIQTGHRPHGGHD